MFNKRIQLFALSMANIIFLNSILPVSAYELNEQGDSIESITYQSSNSESFSNETSVVAELKSEYKVTIPKFIVLSGKNKSANYKVSVKGDIAGTEDVIVKPDETMTLYSKNKDAQIVSISQNKTSWHYDTFDVDAVGFINASNITAGSWTGVFNFNIELKDNKGEVLSDIISLPLPEELEENTVQNIKLKTNSTQNFKNNGYEILSYDDSIIEIENGTIKAIKPGKTNLIFLYNNKEYTTEIEVYDEQVKDEHVHNLSTKKENIIDSTCASNGSFDEVTYCKDCNEELSRTKHTLPLKEHNYGSWQDENGVQVRYCKDNEEHKQLGDFTEYEVSYYDLDSNKLIKKDTYTKETGYLCDDFNAPQKEGYIFNGVFDENSYNEEKDSHEILNEVKIEKGITGNKKYYLDYKEKEYNITYNLNGATTNNNPDKYTISQTIYLKNPQKDGYEFVGWTSNNIKTPQKNVKIEQNSTGDKEFTANFKIATYNITYILNDGTVKNNPDTYNINSCFTLNNPTKDGYEFLGWSGSNGTIPEKEVKIEKGTSGDLKFIAVYKPTAQTLKKSSEYIEPGLYKDEIIVPGSKIVKVGFGKHAKETDILKEARDKQRIYTWDELIEKGYIEVENGVVRATSLAKLENISGKLFLDNSVTKIDDNAFSSWSNLNIDYIPNSVTEIGKCAFFENNAMDGIILSNSITKIGQSAFAKSNLKAIVIPESVIEIDDYAFQKCHKLVSANLKEGLVKIGNYAFSDTALTEVTIPSTVEFNENSNYIFSNCSLLKKATISSNIIPMGTFKDCVLLEEVNIKNNCKQIEAYAFKNCVKLPNIVLPDSLTLIGCEAFKDCTSLESITIPDSVIKMEANTFENCINLKQVKLSNNLSEITTRAFENCKSLERVDIPNSVIYILDEAFEDCRNAEIYIPNSVRVINHKSFRNVKHIYYNGSYAFFSPWGAKAIN